MCAFRHNGIRLKSKKPTEGSVQQLESQNKGLQKPLHRIQQIRTQQDISVRSLARRMDLPVNQVREQEDPACDISLSTLYRWQQALNVPAAELLMEPDDGLSFPIQTRARLLRMMKTIVTLLDEPQPDRTVDLIKNLKTEILAVMPEAEHVDRWHGCGNSRDGREVAAAVLRQIDDALLMDS